jgi:hypothetical protein
MSTLTKDVARAQSAIDVLARAETKEEYSEFLHEAIVMEKLRLENALASPEALRAIYHRNLLRKEAKAA